MPGSGIVTKEQLLAELDLLSPRYGAAAAVLAIELADPRSGSPGESLSRARMFQGGFVMPELQIEVRIPGGKRYDVDFGWKGVRKFGEFDGRAKYTRAEFTAAAQ